MRKKDEVLPPWQLFLTRREDPGTSEATADKNTNKKDEAGITSRSCLWIAEFIPHI